MFGICIKFVCNKLTQWNDSFKTQTSIQLSPNASLFITKAPRLWHTWSSQWLEITGKACQLLFRHHYILHMLSHMLKCSWQVNPKAALFLPLTLFLMKVFLCTSGHQIPRGLQGCHSCKYRCQLKKNWGHNLGQYRLSKGSTKGKCSDLVWLTRSSIFSVYPKKVCGFTKYSL